MKKLVSICLIVVLVVSSIATAYAVSIPEKTKLHIGTFFDDVGLFSEGLVSVQREGKWGYIDKNAKEVIKLQYEDAKDFREGLAAVKKDGKWGYIDKTGSEVIAFQYLKADSFKNGAALVGNGETVDSPGGTGNPCEVYWYIDKKGNRLPDNYNGDTDSSNSTAMDSKSEYKPYSIVLEEWLHIWGFTDKSNKVVIEPEFIAVKDFSEGLAAVKRYGCTRWGFIAAPGMVLETPDVSKWIELDKVQMSDFIIKPKYDQVLNFSEGIACVFVFGDLKMKTLKWGYVDESGKEIIPPIYEQTWPFSEGLGLVNVDVNGKYGFVDKQGNFVIQPQYLYAEPFFEGKALVFVGEHTRILIDKNGKKVNESVDSYVKRKSSILTNKSPIITMRNGKVGLMDGTSHEILVQPVYDDVQGGLNGVYGVKLNGKWGVIDKSGKMLAQPQFDEIAYFENINRIRIRINGKYGFIDETGKIAIDAIYDFAFSFSEGLSLVLVDKKWGYIDLNGAFIIQPKYTFAKSFYDGLAAVATESYGDVYFPQGSSKWSFIDKTGKTVIPEKPYWTEGGLCFSGGYTSAGKDGKVGLIGKPQLPDTWAVKEVDAAIEAKLVPEYLQRYYKRNISRGDFCSLVITLFETKASKPIDDILKEKGLDVKDNPFSDIMDKMVIAANKLGIINGRGNGRFDPDGSITRQEAAVILANAAKYLGVSSTDNRPSFSDADSISSWAQSQVAFVATNGIMGGVGNNRFDPKGYYTRQQAFITMYRMFIKQ